MLKFRGLGVAMVTPFTDGGAVDYDSLARLTNYLIEGGIDYLVVQGTTGEAATLDKDEKQHVLESVVKAAGTRLPIVFGHGGNNTRELIQAFENLNLSGVDAILSASPYYNKPTQAGIIAHYKALADASPKPVILYNVPGRTASNMNAETTLALAEHENIIGIKEASANFSQISAILRYRPERFMVISGDDITALGTLAIGGDGVISVVGNVIPKTYVRMVHDALEGSYRTAAPIHIRTSALVDMLFFEGNPGGIKAALGIKKVIGTTLRLPLVGISETLKQRITEELNDLD